MQIFMQANTNAIAATATSQARALPSGVMDNIVFYNDGASVAFIALGTSAIVATLPALSTNVGAEGNATPVPVGASVNFRRAAGVSHWAAICPAATTTSIYCTTGEGA